MTRPNIYKDVRIKGQITILANETLSTIYDCTVAMSGAGAAALRAISLPDNFTTSDIILTIYDDSVGTNPRTISITDGQNKSVFVIPGCVSSECIGIMNAGAVDYVGFFSITTSIAQIEDTLIDVWLQPIYEGNA